ncbi:AAA family ATPase [uncultured Roseobacter sp.]|uniref:AAA family ATPase n=1 Tax=uncultured Roseobacter sp. TaxID=114847 RepID=UPI002639A2E0|nr:AAA family ATPase [uncultured Roseobacter sp.]
MSESGVSGKFVLDWHSSFVGRDADLKVLHDAWDEARGGTPRVIAIVAESGFGKTRLAQEFYNWLSTTHDCVGDAGYWPDRLLREEDNLRVNPDPADCGGEDGAAMPFLWWGLRLSDPGERNATARGAFAAGLDKLRPHLERTAREVERAAIRRRQLLGGGETAADVALGVGETAVDLISSIGTFGLLGLTKTIGKAAWEHRAAMQDLRSLNEKDVGPAAAQDRGRDQLAEMAIGDLYRLCKVPPRGTEPVPLVVLVDDVQWLDSDLGTASFLGLLMSRARAESWPLLLIITSWQREWRASRTAGTALGALAAPDLGDVIHELAGVAGLDEIVREAFPGLTPAQVVALSDKAEGTPRMLDEMLMYLSRKRKAFVDRDIASALTEAGLEEVLSRDFASFVADRLEEAPDHVRQALAIASTQGVSFSPRLVHRVAEGIMVTDAADGLREGEDPHSFVTGTMGDKANKEAEFRLRAYQLAAREDLGNLLDESVVEDELRAAFSEVAANPIEASEQELKLILEAATMLEDDAEEWNLAAIDTGAELIKRASTAFDVRTAGELADQLLPLFDDEAAFQRRKALYQVMDAKRLWSGPSRELEEKISVTIANLRKNLAAADEFGLKQDLAEAISKLDDIVSVLDGPAVALPLAEELVSICRDLVKDKPTLEMRYWLAVAVSRLGTNVGEISGPAAARPLHEESVEIMRALLAEEPSAKMRRGLSMSLHHLGIVVHQMAGPAASQALRAEELRLSRTLVEEQATPATKDDLVVSLFRMGETQAALEGLAEARTFYEEAVRIARTLSDELTTLGARQTLANALCRLFDVVFALDGPAAARHVCEEEVHLARILAKQNPIPAARRNLAFALSRLGAVAMELDGPIAARALREEEERLVRQWVADQPTHGARGELARTLSRLGETVEATDGPAAALHLYEEALEITRILLKEQPTLSIRRDLSIRLADLGRVLNTLKGPATARSLHEEEVKLSRALATEQVTPEARQDLVLSLVRFGEVLNDLGDPAEAYPLLDEAVSIARALTKEQPTPGVQRALASAVCQLFYVVEALDGLVAARPLCEEEVHIYRSLAENSQTLSSRSNLSIALSRLGRVVAELDGPAAALSYCEEAESRSRALFQEHFTPETRRNLASTLFHLGNMVEALNGPTAAKPLVQEMVDISDALAEEQHTAQSRRDLAIALSKHSGIVEEIEGPAAARPLHEREEQINRTLFEEQNTYPTRRDLMLCLSRNAAALEKVDGPAAAMPIVEEMVIHARTSFQENPTRESERDMAHALSRLSTTTIALKGSRAARPFVEEMVDIFRKIAREHSTPEARYELASGLSRLSDIVLKFDGSRAVKPLIEEEERLMRELAQEQASPGAKRDHAFATSRLASVTASSEGAARARHLREQTVDIVRQLAEEEDSPTANMNLVGALDQLADTIHDTEGIQAARPLWNEAYHLVEATHDGHPSEDTHVWLLALRQRLIQIELLEPQPWRRAFALEILTPEAAVFIPRIEALLKDFEDWAKVRDPSMTSGWVEGVLLDLARCHLAYGRAEISHEILLSCADSLAAAHEAHIGKLTPLATNHAILSGIAALNAGFMIPASENFQRATELAKTNQDTTPYTLRRDAVIGWFHASCLQQLDRAADAHGLYEAGHLAAKGFARFGMQDGTAILQVYQ